MLLDYAPRRVRLAPAFQLTDEVLLIGAGLPVPKPELSDQHLPFVAHQEYYYLTGHNDAPGAVLAYDPKTREWVSFVPVVTEMDRVWEGREQLPGEPLDRLPAWLESRRGRPVVMLGAPLAGVAADAEKTAIVRERYRHARRFKDHDEVDLLLQCAKLTARAYSHLPSLLRPGVSERALQIELETQFYREGAHGLGYDTIIGFGAQSAVFHGSPSPYRTARDGDFLLIDAGPQLNRYVIDVTRTYVLGEPLPFQRDLYQAVLQAQHRACNKCRPGVEWKDLHLATAVDLVTSLCAMGILRGQPESLVEQDAHTLFFPHGLGHMVGLGVRDASGLEPGRTKDPRPSLRSLRMDLILREGFFVTVEPGLYIIPALLDDPARRERYRDAVNWGLVEEYYGIGGVRLEDNVLVTGDVPLNLTVGIPKQKL